jgi:long-chain acyl-CoA synthetase
MLGDKRKFPILLVVPNLDLLRAWAAESNLTFASDADLVASVEAGNLVEREIKKGLRDLAQFEMPKKVVLIEKDFSIETGEITPTLKVKRRVVEKNYQKVIEAAYAEPKGGKHDV